MVGESRDLGVAFQAPPGSQTSSRREAKDSALLSSRDVGFRLTQTRSLEPTQTLPLKEENPRLQRPRPGPVPHYMGWK